MKNLILSLFTLCAINAIAQDKMVQFESHTLTGETVVFEGKDLSTGEAVSTRPYLLSELENEALATNGNNVRYWLFEGCYKYETASATELNKGRAVLSGHSGGWSLVEQGNDNASLHTAAHEAAHVIQQRTGSTVEIINAKEWVRPCPSH